MADAGVAWRGRPGDLTPVTVAIPIAGDRALVSVMPELTVDVETLVGISTRAVVVDLPSVSRLPEVPRIYAVVGDPEVALLRGRLPSSLAGVDALILNQREAMGLTERADAHSAAQHLASLGATVVVTRGAAGALAVEPDGRTVEVSAPSAEVADPTGAGDLFIAAYVWADLTGRPLEDRLRQAVRYASASLEQATDGLKGITLREFEALPPG